MEAESSASTAAAGEEWDRAAGGEVEEKARDGEASPAVDSAPAVGAEVVCSGEGSQRGASAAVKRRGKRRPNFLQTSLSHPENQRCSGCQEQFERQGRSFNRRALYTFTNLETARWAFPRAPELHDESFLCETCAQLIRSKCKKRQCGKRTLWIRPIDETQKEMPFAHFRPVQRRMGKKSRAAMLVSKSCYKAAFKVLWSAKGARKPMLDFLSRQLKMEMKALSRQAGSPFHLKVGSSKPMAMFPWRRCSNWAQEKAPLVTHCIKAMFPDMGALARSSHVLTQDQAAALLDRRIVTTLSIPLFTRNVYKNNFLQASLGAELRLQGVSGSGLDQLNSLGLSQNKDTVRQLLLRLMQGRRGKLLTNGRLGQKLKQEQLKAETTADVEEGEEGVECEDREEEEGSEELETESNPERAVNEVTVEIEEDAEVDAEVEEENVEEPSNRRKNRRKRKHPKEEEEDAEGKKGRVVVVRLGLLHEHSDT